MTEEDRLLLNDLKSNVQQLFGKFRQLETENSNLHEEIIKLRERIGEMEKEKSELSRKNEQLLIANGLLSGDTEKSEVRQKINSLIREIDKCIALLNQ
jgi:chaperonin cofactor prefoldin